MHVYIHMYNMLSYMHVYAYNKRVGTTLFINRPAVSLSPHQSVELKNGETYNGHLVNCDSWMNIRLREVVCTAREGDRFWRMPECYVRGNTIKYLRVPDEVSGAHQE